MALGIIGIVIALAIFLYGAYKNVSVLYLAPLCAVIVAVTNGLNPTNAFTGLYVGQVDLNGGATWEGLIAALSFEEGSGMLTITGLCGMITAVFPTVFLGGIFGKVLTDSGAAQCIAATMIDRFVMTVEGKEKQAKRAVLIMLLVECILTFGGVDGFVAIFATFPICMFMASRIGIPRRFVPAMLALSCGANSAPFVLSINNIICMSILGTSPGAAAIPSASSSWS